MVSTVPPSPSIPTDVWVQASWAQYLDAVEGDRSIEKHCYYNSGEMRIEMAPLGPSHGRDNAILSKVVSLFATFYPLYLLEYVNCTFRSPGLRDAQPDLAFYVGQSETTPPRTNEPVDVSLYGCPQLVIEIASTSLSDDLGPKRLLYERFGVREYWVVNVATGEAIAFSIEDGRSGEVRDSVVLPRLSMTTVEEALQRGRTEDDGVINRWLIDRFR